jgi:cysteine synthase A
MRARAAEVAAEIGGYQTDQFRNTDMIEGYRATGVRRAVEGILSGPSTGANLIAALQLAARLGPGHTVVTIRVDSGLKYLAGDLFNARS